MLIADAIDYDAPVEEVFDMLTTEVFQVSKCRATGALNQHVEIRRTAGSTAIVTKRTLPTRKFPDFVRQFVGDTLLVVQTDVWGEPDRAGTRRGTIMVQVEGAPIKLQGTLLLRDAGSGCREDIKGDLKAAVPLIGGRIEKAAAPAVMSAINAERRVGHDWLSAGGLHEHHEHKS